MRDLAHILLLCAAIWGACVLLSKAVHAVCEAIYLPTPAAEASGEQSADSFDARSADPARRGFNTYLLIDLRGPAAVAAVEIGREQSHEASR